MAECGQDSGLIRRWFLSHTQSIFLFSIPAQTRTQIANQFHGPLCGHVDSCVFQLQFNGSQMCQGDSTTQEMASDFRVGPVPDREHADQVVIGLPEGKRSIYTDVTMYYCGDKRVGVIIR
jgi:hypothetical protein